MQNSIMRINLSLFLLVYSFGALSSAYISQYVFGMEPCILCLYQRWPYFFIIFFSIIAVCIKESQKLRLFLLTLCGISLLVGAGIAFFHVGVEQGKFTLGDGCEVAEGEAPSSVEELTKQLMGAPTVPCNIPQFVFLGLSMAGWNFIFSGSFGLITLIMVYRMYGNIRLIRVSDAHRKKNKKKSK